MKPGEGDGWGGCGASLAVCERSHGRRPPRVRTRQPPNAPVTATRAAAGPRGQGVGGGAWVWVDRDRRTG